MSRIRQSAVKLGAKQTARIASRRAVKDATTQILGSSNSVVGAAVVSGISAALSKMISKV